VDLAWKAAERTRILIEAKSANLYIGKSDPLAPRIARHLQLVHFSGHGQFASVKHEPRVTIRSNPAPVEKVSRLARLCMSAEAHQQLIWPTIQDLRLEYEDAQKTGDRFLAWRVLIGGYASLFVPWLYGLAARALRRMFST
jgi:hypothetical protein